MGVVRGACLGRPGTGPEQVKLGTNLGQVELIGSRNQRAAQNGSEAVFYLGEQPVVVGDGIEGWMVALEKDQGADGEGQGVA